MGKKIVELLSTFRWLKVDAAPGIYNLMPTVNLVVGKKMISRYLTSELKAAAGLIEFQHLKEADHLIVSLSEENDCWDGRVVHGEHALKIWMMYLDWALQDTWLISDNCFICEIAYCKFTMSGKTYWCNNNLYAQASMADGNRMKTVTWNEEMIGAWATEGLRLREHLHTTGFDIFTDITSNKVTRFARFLQFVQAARRETFPAIKIAQMCSALESLFSTTDTELTHRLSERVAFFLGGDPQQMEDTYRFIKKAYAIRSQVTHGAPVSARLAGSTAEISKEMLDILRKIAFKVISVGPEGVVYKSNEHIEDHFRRCLFN